MREFLLELLEYDAWATDQWLATLPNWKDSTASNAIFHHLLGAKRIWLIRCGVPVEENGENYVEASVRLNEGWHRLVAESNLDEVIAYHNLAGLPFARPFEQIVRHVVNHGTYHRGDLRCLAAQGGLEKWPETDLVLFYDQRR